MTIDDVSEVLMSAEKFKELYDAIRECYKVANDCYNAARKLDILLGTAIKDSIHQKKLEHHGIESFKAGFHGQ